MKKIILSIVFISAILLAFFVEKLFWVIIPLLAAGILLYLAIRFSQAKLASIAIVLACMLIFFSMAEGYMQWNKPVDSTRHSESKYIISGVTSHEAFSNVVPDDLLGFSTKPMQIKTAGRRVDEGITTYDVLYSMDEKGRRITPDNSSTAETLIILLGCSFTFGFGLEDQETFAWQLGEQLGPDFQVLNYGYNGYGSHQMLALLENGYLDDLKGKYNKVYVFYLTIGGVEIRSAGLAPWDTKGPQYLLASDGTLSYTGSFPKKFAFTGISKKSFFLNKIVSLYHYNHNSDDNADRLDLHAAIVLEARNIINSKFEGEFITITYPNSELLQKRLAKGNMQIIDLAAYFDNFDSHREKYFIKYDGHPNFTATKLITKAISEYLEKKPSVLD